MTRAASGPVDAHVHVASDDQTRFPRHPTGLASDWWRRGRYQADDVLGTLAAAGVAQMVAVQAAGAYGDDNRYVVAVAQQHPGSVRAVAVVDPDGPRPSQVIAELAECQGVCGVRYMAVRPTTMWVGTRRAHAAFESAGHAGLTVVLTVFSPQLAALRPVLEQFPDVPVVLDHCAFPHLEGGAMARDDPLLEVVDLPQVAVKVTSHNLAPLAGAGAGRTFAEQLVAWFGPHRVVWGSDYPQTGHDTYAGLVDLARQAVGGLVPAEQAAVLGDNARRLFGFDAGGLDAGGLDGGGLDAGDAHGPGSRSVI